MPTVPPEPVLTENVTQPMRVAISKFYETGSLEQFSHKEIELLPLMMVELVRNPSGDNLVIFELLKSGVEEFEQPGDTPSLAYALAREISTKTLLEPDNGQIDSAPLLSFIGDELQREARNTRNPDVFYEIAQFFAMKDMHAVFPDSSVSPILLAMVENQQMEETLEQLYFGSIGLAFQGYALQFPTKEDLVRRVTEDYPRIKSIASPQVLEWIQKHTQQTETWIKQGYDPFRFEAQHVLGIRTEQTEALVELRKKVGMIVPAAFLAEQGRVWESWNSNELLEEVGKEVAVIIKGG